VDNPYQKRIVGSLFSAQSLFSAALIAALTLSSIVAADLSGSESAAGLPATVILIARAALAYPAGLMLDKIGRRLGLTVSYALGAAALFFSAWAIFQGSFSGFLIGLAFFGGSRAASEQSRYIAAEIFPPNKKAKAIGTIVFAGTIGAVVGPLLVQPSTTMSENIGLGAAAGPYIAGGILLVFAAVVVFVLVRPDPLKIGRQLDAQLAEESEIETENGPGRSLKEIFRQPMPLLAAGSMVIGQIVMVLLMVITPVHMDRNDHGTQTISLIIMAHTIGMFALSGVTGWLIDKIGRRIVIASGAIILIAACLLVPYSDGVLLLALALFLLGLGWNFCFIAGSSLLTNQLVSKERGRAQGVGEMAVALGAGIGSFSSGIIFAASGILALSLFGIGLSFVLLLWVVWLRIPRKQAQLLPAGQD